MHLRVNTTHRNNKTYRYAQLVESYRREDGVPTHRVVKHLGALPEPVIAALRLALKAGRSGERVILASEAVAALNAPIIANLRYLDLAVLIDCWQTWNLSKRLTALAGETRTTLSLAKIVLCLVLQRCCIPRSKVEATRWVPTTALPHLLDFDAAAFNNTRVHRALLALHHLNNPIQDELVAAYRQRDKTFNVLFMDVTDTYFEGMGSPTAEKTRTKTEMPSKRCLAIVLLVNENGFPLRWKVLGGKTKDWHAMQAMLSDLDKVPWVQGIPIVFDRAMGNPSTVAQLNSMGVHFLTAAHVDTIEGYGAVLPYDAFAAVEIVGTDDTYESDVQRVAQAARNAGLEEIHEHLFVIDLGVVVPKYDASSSATKQDGTALPRSRVRGGLARQLRRARAIRKRMQADSNLTQYAVAASQGLTPSRVTQLLALLRLSPEVQDRILQLGKACPVTEIKVREWFHLDPREQLKRLNQALANTTPTHSSRPAKCDRQTVGPLRMVAYFNPRLFVDIRRRTAGHCDMLQRTVNELNDELATAKRSRNRDSTYRKFSRELERLHYLGAFDISLREITVEPKAGKTIRSFQGTITRNESHWERRRRYDGFVLLLAHSELPHSAAELVNMYRSKDVIEKDFQSIKSVIKLRPIFHYTDPKVEAHVTVCILALLMERTLRRRLHDAGMSISAPTAINVLSTCHLNKRSTDLGPCYDVTELSREQKEILDLLKLTDLAHFTKEQREANSARK